MSARNVNLTDRLNDFVDKQVRNGRHQNASEVVREALRRYEAALAAENARVEAVRAVIREGRAAIARGDFVTIGEPRDSKELFSRLTRRNPTPRRRQTP